MFCDHMYRVMILCEDLLCVVKKFKSVWLVGGVVLCVIV